MKIHEREKETHTYINTHYSVLRCFITVVCRKTNGEVNISHENTSMVVWIYDDV